MPAAPNNPIRVYGYVRSPDVAIYVGTTGGLLPDAQQRILIGEAYSQGFSNLFLYSFDSTITAGVFSAAAKNHLITFIRLCIPWGIRIGIPMGNISNTKLGAIFDFNQTVATSAAETIDYVLEDEYWNNGYGDFVRVRDAQTFWHTNLLASGARSLAYTGFTKQNGDSYGENFNITSAVAGVGVVTFTTSTNHNFIAGGTCELSGVSGFANNPNGQFVMSSAAANTFQITHFAGGGAYGGGATVSSVYVGSTELQELQSLFDEFHLHDYALIPYHKYQQSREAEFTIPVEVADIISTESTTQFPAQANNFSGNFMVGQDSAGTPSFPTKSFVQAYQYINIDTQALGLVPNQVSSPRYFNADTTPSIVANITKVGLSVFTLSFMRGRAMTDGTRIMVFAGANQVSLTAAGIISLSDAYRQDDWLPIGATLVYTWSVVTAPVGATVQTFSNVNAPNPAFTFAAPAGTGNWVLRLSVTDGITTSFDDMTLFIDAASGLMTVSLTELKLVTCNGGTDGEVRATVTGGVAPYTFAYSNGVTHAGIVITTDDLTGLASGVISVTVTDSLGATASDSFTVVNPPAIVITLTPTNPLCPGNSNGSIVAVVTGGSAAGPYTLDWAKNTVPFVPADPLHPINLTLGLYELTVTDAGGCVRSASINLIDPVAITEIDVILNPSCFGGNDGEITVTASGGTGTLSYVWLDPLTGMPYVPAQIAPKLINLTADNYTVIVTDANGCTQSFTFTVSDPAPILVSVTPLSATDFCLGGFVDLEAAVVSGGTGPYSYAWSGPTGLVVNDPTNFPQIATFTPVVSGIYSISVIVTDANGCVGTAGAGGVVAAAFSTSPIIQPGGVLGSCPGDTVTLTITNFADFGAVLWDTSETTASITVDVAGNYCVQGFSPALDGCFNTSCILITVTPTTIQLIGTTNNVCGGNNAIGAVNISTIGGCPAYTWQWFNVLDPTTILATTEDITGLATGSYTVIATDTLGGTATATFTVITSSPSVDITFTNIRGNTGGTATANITGGSSPFSIVWTDPNGTTYSGDTISNLFVQGMYIVTVTDANGCIATDIACISNVYSFGMSECEFKCFLQQMSCCQADLVYKMIEADKGGRETCVQKVELMESYLELLECYYPEGATIRAGQFAYYVLTINSYSNGGTLVIDLLGTQIVNYTFDTGSTFTQNLDNIVAQLLLAGQVATYDTDGSSYANLIINAPTIGAGWNCVTMTVTNTGSNIVTLTTDGFTGGVDTIIADPPCLSDEEINNVIESMKCVCSCDCTNLTTLTSDNLIY